MDKPVVKPGIVWKRATRGLFSSLADIVPVRPWVETAGAQPQNSPVCFLMQV